MVLPDGSTIKTLSDQIEDLSPHEILTDSELRNELPSDSRTGILLDRDMKAAFSIYKPGYVRIQPFLLIDRTRHIVTAFGIHGLPKFVVGMTARVSKTSSAGYFGVSSI